MAYIEKRGNSYRLLVYLGTDENGKKRYKWVTLKGNSKARNEQVKRILYEAQNGTFIEPGKVTVAEFFDRWYDEHVKPNLAPGTDRGYEMNIRNHIKPQLGKYKLTALSKTHISNFYTDRLKYGLSAQTVKHLKEIIHSALETAIEWELINLNVSDGITLPTITKPEMQVWNINEVNLFVNALKESEYYPLFHLDLFTGLRRSELLGLRWKDINLATGELSINRSLHYKHTKGVKGGTFEFRPPKSKKGQRSIPLTPLSLEVMNAHYEHSKAIMTEAGLPFDNETLVFCHQDTGLPLLPSSISHAWTRIIKSLGLKRIRLHDARHTHASILLAMGVHPAIVQQRLGHSSIQITIDTYSHLLPGLQQAAAKSFDAILTNGYNNRDDKETKNDSHE